MSDPSSLPDQNVELIVSEIERVMAAYIPDFGRKFSANFQEAAINEVRAEKSFEITTARALVFGETGVGKTTTINFLLDNPIFPTSGELSCTKSLACGEHEGGLIFYDSPGLGDEEGLENVTRTALGIPPLADEPLDSISLIDITAKNAEGPATFTPLTYEEFADEISPEFYRLHQDRIVAKRFALDDFAAWAASHFDFFVFVTSSNRGLPTPIAKILQTFDQTQQHHLKLFKVFNVFQQGYREEVAALEPGVRKKFEQALERSEKYTLRDPAEWLMIDSQSGAGVDALVRAFAEALPLDVLRSLNQVVKQQYAPLLQEKITAYFFDYTAHIAALMAVLPVDHAEQEQHFLKFALDSIATMARFMFAGQSDLFSSQLINDLVGELEFRKQRTVYTKVEARRKKESLLLNLADKVGKKLKPDFDAYDELNAYETTTERVAGPTYFAVGGVDAIQVILGLGLALETLHQEGEQADFSLGYLEAVLEASRRVIEASMGFHIRSQVIRVTRLAGEYTSRAEKLQMAAELFPHIRPLLAGED